MRINHLVPNVFGYHNGKVLPTLENMEAYAEDTDLGLPVVG